MLFTERVANWEPRMFSKVPRAADDDENYARIRAKNFQSVREPLVVNTPPETAPVPAKPPETPVHFTPMTPTAIPDLEPSVPEPTPEPASELVMTQQVSVPKQEPTLNNTPFQGGIVLPGKPVDKKEDKFVEPGATFTFGDDE